MKGILGSGGCFHDGSETRKSMRSSEVCMWLRVLADTLATQVMVGWALSFTQVPTEQFLGRNWLVLITRHCFTWFVFNCVRLGSVKYSLFRRTMWIFEPENNLKKSCSSG